MVHDLPGNFTMDLSVEEQHGPLIVIPFIHEEVGNKWVSGVAFVKPAVSLDEIQEDLNEGFISADQRQFEFTMAKTETKFRKRVAAWKSTMSKNKKSQKTGKLTEQEGKWKEYFTRNKRKELGADEGGT